MSSFAYTPNTALCSIFSPFAKFTSLNFFSKLINNFCLSLYNSFVVVSTLTSSLSFSNTTFSISLSIICPSGAFTSLISYSPRYNSLLTAIPSLPVVIVSTFVPFVSYVTLPSGDFISSAVYISYVTPSSGITSHTGVYLYPYSVCSILTSNRPVPVFTISNLPFNGSSGISTI